VKILALQLEKTSGCAIMIDGKIVYATSEERFTRIKSDSSFPKQSIENGLKTAGISAKDLDKVLICSKEVTLYAALVNLYSSLSVSDQLRMMKEYWEPKLVQGKTISFLYMLQDKIEKNTFPFNTKHAKIFEFLQPGYKFEKHKKDQKKPFQSPEDAKQVSKFYFEVISDLLKIDKSKIAHIDHHTCHAAYAFYGSPIRDDKTLVVTADAFGDYLSGSVSMYDKKTKKISRLKTYSHKEFQLARIYRFTTLYLKMLADSHEYKVMGLAPYYSGSKAEEVERIFDKLQKLEGIEIKFNQEVKNIYHFLENNLNNYRFDHIASGLQKFTEKILVNWFKNLIKKYKSSSIVFSGGTSMNVKANMKISEIDEIKKIFICGSGTDDTLPIGACYFWAEQNNKISKPLANMYLGMSSEYKNSEINSLFSKYDIKNYSSPDQILEILQRKKIIAVCRGRAEMGQRSLGNRSIIADPTDFSVVKKINEAIKQRDFWMPFAPVILSEHQNDLIYNPKNIESPFMTIAFNTKKNGEDIPAAVHQADKTARAQLLKKNENPELWELIFKFYKKTNIPALLNTSFNLHGYPIVNSIHDAKKVFEKSDLQVLWLDNHIIEKK
tara:strand:+ start:11591 stop:13417 length:1827 start_codon:yes stop_codon:yes gene_type:complete